jgi:hypothetical protein
MDKEADLQLHNSNEIQIKLFSSDRHPIPLAVLV